MRVLGRAFEIGKPGMTSTTPSTTDSLPATHSGPAWSAYKTRDDLQKYAPNSLVLFVSEMILAVDDIGSFASESITDHGNDKKCDLVYISREDGKIVVAQNYESQNLLKGISEQKTTDLNTAVSWLLTGDVQTLPDRPPSQSTALVL